MWRYQRVVTSHFFIIHPNSCLNMRALQEKDDSFLIPISGNIYFFLIPGYAYVMLYRRKPERNFYIARLPVFCQRWAKEKGAVINTSGPFRLQGYLIPLPVFCHSAGKFDHIGTSFLSIAKRHSPDREICWASALVLIIKKSKTHVLPINFFMLKENIMIKNDYYFENK